MKIHLKDSVWFLLLWAYHARKPKERIELLSAVVDPDFHEEVDLLLYNGGCVEIRTQGLIPSEALGAFISGDNHDWPTAVTSYQQNANQSLSFDTDLKTGGKWWLVEKEDNKHQFLRRNCSCGYTLPDCGSFCKSFSSSSPPLLFFRNDD